MFELTTTNRLLTDNFNRFDLSTDDIRHHYSKYTENDFQFQILDNENLEFSLNVIGHNPEDILVETNDTYLFIKSKELDGKLNTLAKTIDSKFRIHKDYDTSNPNATIKNGILTIVFNKREEKLNKKIKIKY